MEIKPSKFIGFFIFNVNAGGKTVGMSGRAINQQRQLWVLGISEFSPQNWDGFGIKTEVLVQLFSQKMWLWRVKPVKTATVKNTCKLLSHKTVTLNSDKRSAHQKEPHSFRNHDNGSETSTDNISVWPTFSTKKNNLFFSGDTNVNSF